MNYSVAAISPSYWKRSPVWAGGFIPYGTLPRVSTLRPVPCGYRAFTSSHSDLRTVRIKLAALYHGNPRGLVYIAGRRWTYDEVNLNPELLAFDLHPRESGRTYENLWDEATSELRGVYESEGRTGLERVSANFDRYSLRDFLLERGFSEGALELYGLMSFVSRT